MRLGKARDLSPGRDAADPRQVENDDVDGARFEQDAKRVEVIEVLAGAIGTSSFRRSSASPVTSEW